MTSTQDFRTKTIFNKRKNVGLDDSWPIAIDIGYSGTKIMSPNGLFSFPSYAIKVSKNQVRLGNIQSTDLIFHDLETDETWFVGAMAQNFMDSDSSEDSEATLYNRKRYHSPMFKVISSVGLALGRTENEFSSPKGKQMCIQTGLPPKYIKILPADLLHFCAIYRHCCYYRNICILKNLLEFFCPFIILKGFRPLHYSRV